MELILGLVGGRGGESVQGRYMGKDRDVEGRRYMEARRFGWVDGILRSQLQPVIIAVGESYVKSLALTDNVLSLIDHLIVERWVSVYLYTVSFIVIWEIFMVRGLFSAFCFFVQIELQLDSNLLIIFSWILDPSISCQPEEKDIELQYPWLY